MTQLDRRLTVRAGGEGHGGRSWLVLTHSIPVTEDSAGSAYPDPGQLQGPLAWAGSRAEPLGVLPVPDPRCPSAFPAPAALGSAIWPWHLDWFGRFHHTPAQWEGWSWGRPGQRKQCCPALDPHPQIPASPQLPFLPGLETSSGCHCG